MYDELFDVIDFNGQYKKVRLDQKNLFQLNFLGGLLLHITIIMTVKITIVKF